MFSSAPNALSCFIAVNVMKTIKSPVTIHSVKVSVLCIDILFHLCKMIYLTDMEDN